MLALEIIGGWVVGMVIVVLFMMGATAAEKEQRDDHSR